eukprot:6481521-Amphidinium_carterae.2
MKREVCRKLILQEQKSVSYQSILGTACLPIKHSPSCIHALVQVLERSNILRHRKNGPPHTTTSVIELLRYYSTMHHMNPGVVQLTKNPKPEFDQDWLENSQGISSFAT